MTIEPIVVQHTDNRGYKPQALYGAQQLSILGGDAFKQAKKQIQNWPDYQPTPLYPLAGLARNLNIAALHYKDEGGRFGLGSFKALGGAYAVSRLLLRQLSQQLNRDELSVTDLLSGRLRAWTEKITVTCATDGNHGRSVAWGAQRFGCQCIIYIHATVSEERKSAIESYGAKVVRTSGNYDDCVRQADEDARREGRFIVSDTSYAGYMDVPKDVMQGYAIMADEVLAQLRAIGEAPPTHIFLQGGVGGLAAAVVAHFWENLQQQKPIFVVVEPEKAACLFESAKVGKPTAVRGALDTVMAGLACGEVSLLAWEILYPATRAFLTIPDEAALDTMRLLANAPFGDRPITAGESAVAGLAGLIGVRAESGLAHHLDINTRSRILIFGSEGATDPKLYQQIVGRPPQGGENVQ